MCTNSEICSVDGISATMTGRRIVFQYDGLPHPFHPDKQVSVILSRPVLVHIVGKHVKKPDEARMWNQILTPEVRLGLVEKDPSSTAWVTFSKVLESQLRMCVERPRVMSYFSRPISQSTRILPHRVWFLVTPAALRVIINAEPLVPEIVTVFPTQASAGKGGWKREVEQRVHRYCPPTSVETRQIPTLPADSYGYQNLSPYEPKVTDFCHFQFATPRSWGFENEHAGARWVGFSQDEPY